MCALSQCNTNSPCASIFEDSSAARNHRNVLPMTASRSTRSPRMRRHRSIKSPTKLNRSGCAGLAAGTRVMAQPVIKPNTARPASTIPARPGAPSKATDNNPPTCMPRTMPRKVPSSSRPLPQDNFFSGNNSGNEPYFAGPKMALCMPMKNKHTSTKLSDCRAKATVAMIMTTISKHLIAMMTLRLANRVASEPPNMEKKMNGNVSSARVSMISRSCSRSPRPRLMPMNRANCLSALSLKAP